jgi:hypothetical protein
VRHYILKNFTKKANTPKRENSFFETNKIKRKRQSFLEIPSIKKTKLKEHFPINQKTVIHKTSKNTPLLIKREA